jgi:hypothetical protein
MRDLLAAHFDFDDMSRSVLGTHWKGLPDLNFPLAQRFEIALGWQTLTWREASMPRSRRAQTWQSGPQVHRWTRR